MLHRIRHARGAVLGAAGAALLLTAACETFRNPLEVEESSRIPADVMEVPGNAQLLVDGAIADFECAFAAYVVQSAAVGDEFIYAQQTAARTASDARRVIPTDQEYSAFSCQAFGIYVPIHTARASAERVLNLLANVWTDAEVLNRQRLIGLAATYAGYSYVLLGEGFCTSAVSRVNPDRSIDYGGEIQRDSVFRIAITRFTEAINAANAAQAAAPAAINLEIIRTATLGRARARLNLGDYAGAKADAEAIPVGFVRNATYSDAVGRRNNFVFNNNATTNRLMSIDVPYRNLNDPRVPVVQGTIAPTTSPTGVPHWHQTKYATAGVAIPLARYHEAQLIIAEAEIRANNLAAALPILQDFRTRGNQDPFVGVTMQDYLNELIDQRRRELFLEGHHLGDIIRFGLLNQLFHEPGKVYHFGGAYGSQLCFPLPQSERLNNPAVPLN